MNILSYGRPDPLPARQTLRAGPLTLELEEGDLRYIRLGDRELLRRVYVAVRDPNWGIIPAVYSQTRQDIGPDRFTISFLAEHVGAGIDFAWHGRIAGDADGTVRYTLEGQARATFQKNRLGFCVLHPMAECAGAACMVRHVDGSVEEGRFPEIIVPHQPFMDFTEISHQVLPGLEAMVELTGESFEMEDQRNWTDASFKTYGTPLRLPFPVEVAVGTRIRQSCTVRLRGDPPPAARSDRRVVDIAVDPGLAAPLPALGLGMASHGQPLSERELERLRALRLAHLRVDLDPSDPVYPETLGRAAREASAVGAGLEIALHLSDAAETELAALAGYLAEPRPAIVRWLVFHKREPTTAAGWVSRARRSLADLAPEAAFAGGTDAYFTQLNRDRPATESMDAVCYSLNPQVHAFDIASLVETLPAQAATLESARRFCGRLPLVVSPVTLRPRFNPDATGPPAPPGADELPVTVDARQMALFGAGWTTASLKYLALGGASSITLYETTGWQGVMEREGGSPLSIRFPSRPGMLFPLYHVLRDVGEFAGGQVLGTVSSAPLAVDALTLRLGDRTCLLLANFRPDPQEVQVTVPGARAVTIRHLDEHSVTLATEDGPAFRRQPGTPLPIETGRMRLTLQPFAVARVEIGYA